MEIIHAKIKIIEQDFENSDFQSPLKWRAIQCMKSWLKQIDFTAECIPVDTVDRLESLFVDLKGAKLTSAENNLIHELISV
jgi:hypothetical protein